MVWGIGHSGGNCFLEFTDGVRWTCLELGLVEFQDSQKNILVKLFPGQMGYDSAAPREDG